MTTTKISTNNIMPNTVTKNTNECFDHLYSLVLSTRNCFEHAKYWKFDGINKSLILKNKVPIVLPLSGLEPSQLGNTLISLSRQSQVNSEALLELVRILDIYFKS
mgnify:CR=1 FL=1